MPAVERGKPLYKADYKIRLPKHAPWRTETQNVRRIIEANDPIQLIIGSITDLVAVAGFGGDANFLVGLFANLINPAPESVRGAIAASIISGMGMDVGADKDGYIVAEMVQKWNSLNTGQGQQRPSGLVVPGEETPKLYIPGQEV